MQFFREIQLFMNENENTIKSLVSLLSIAVSIATFLMTRWMKRRMRLEAEQRHEEASREGQFSFELSTIQKGVLKNDILEMTAGVQVIPDPLLFKKIMETENRGIAAEDDGEIGNIGLLMLPRIKDTKGMLLAMAAQVGKHFITERVKARLGGDGVEVKFLIAFRHDTYIPDGDDDGFRTSRAFIVPLMLVERIGTDLKFWDSVEYTKFHQRDRKYHMREMWRAYTSTDPDVKATVWEFTLVFPRHSFPDGLADWKS